MQKGAKTDPRAVRSAAALRDAILDLASRGPIETVSVAEVCRWAGVSRGTFYNHAQTPSLLLQQELTRELDELRSHMEVRLTASSGEVRSVFGAGMLEVLQHVRTRSAIYGFALGDRINPDIYQVLTDHFRVSLRYWLDRVVIGSPGLPEAADPAGSSATGELLASYFASGYVGAVRSWARNPMPGGDRLLVEVLIAALPPWMLSERPLS